MNLLRTAPRRSSTSGRTGSHCRVVTDDNRSACEPAGPVKAAALPRLPSSVRSDAARAAASAATGDHATPFPHYRRAPAAVGLEAADRRHSPSVKNSLVRRHWAGESSPGRARRSCRTARPYPGIEHERSCRPVQHAARMRDRESGSSAAQRQSSRPGRSRTRRRHGCGTSFRPSQRPAPLTTTAEADQNAGPSGSARSAGDIEREIASAAVTAVNDARRPPIPHACGIRGGSWWVRQGSNL